MKYYMTGLDAADALALSRKLWDLFLPAVKVAPESWRYEYAGPEGSQCWMNQIARKEVQVWVVVDLEADDIIAALTTSISQTDEVPGVTLLEIPLVAGKDMRHWIGPALKILNAWGKEQGADIMVAYGRKGWERIAGFEYYGEDVAGIRIMIRPIGGFH